MQRISTNLTLFFKFFVPVFWLVFFGAFTLAIFTFGQDLTPLFQDFWFRIGVVIFYASGALLFYFVLFPLKRLEGNADYVYVTNYFKTYRYPWSSVVSVEEGKFLAFTVGKLVLKEPGLFGQSMPFIGSNRYYEAFWETYPDLTHLRQ
ncbi:MAG: hypothetical protein AAGJ82_09210 [Bacteroidota bacterium]